CARGGNYGNYVPLTYW
nr:immunoglobulin heavy chain junction region [Mus musculus]MBK4189598.1 immunoglobulin heavy chain junction region [Mus musculus]MBK4189599.1 immunoglobulin heavy chain junction region [Mus musculus]MBK4189600.1 immunoglobulin heavy chain junction region [Mus musculus]MBK4189601.1 immunoglobulin heavy chain junction region [Mus musculus]